MSVTVAVRRAGDGTAGWSVTGRSAGGELFGHELPAWVDDTGRWWPAPADGPLGPETFAEIADRIRRRAASQDEARRYGQQLFHALLGTEGWRAACAGHAAGDDLEVRLSWPAGDGDLHRMMWETLHDGTGFLALREKHPVVFIREVPPAGDGGGGAADWRPVAGLPRMLFAVGSRLSDDRVRPGAEFMGVLRGLQREGGAVLPRVLAPASLGALAGECARLRPDIVHLIGHGRWDDLAGHGYLEMRSDENEGKTDEVSGARLGDALTAGGGAPSAVVLSACESAAAFSQAGSPLAAELIAAGVPLVIGMAGDIADTACRVFTRSVMAAVFRGLPLTWAVARGRRAAFLYRRHEPTSLDWALPVLFAAPGLPPAFRLVDTARASAVRDRVVKLDLARAPVFCGRDEFFDSLDRLLDPASPQAVLTAFLEHGSGHFGGSRLLRELGATALRLGHLPCFVGPFELGGAPTTVLDLVVEVAIRIVKLRQQLGVDGDWHCRALDAAADVLGVELPTRVPARMISGMRRYANEARERRRGGEKVPDLAGLDVVDALRDDLRALGADAGRAHGDLLRADPQVLLLLDDVHLYDRALDALTDEMLGPSGLGTAERVKVPVVMFGKAEAGNGARLLEAAERHGGGGLYEFLPVRHFEDIARRNNTDEDLLVYQTWLLHPEPATGGPAMVLAPSQAGGTGWGGAARLALAMEDDRLYHGPKLRKLASYIEEQRWFTPEDDNAIMRAYGIEVVR